MIQFFKRLRQKMALAKQCQRCRQHLCQRCWGCCNPDCVAILIAMHLMYRIVSAICRRVDNHHEILKANVETHVSTKTEEPEQWKKR